MNRTPPSLTLSPSLHHIPPYVFTPTPNPPLLPSPIPFSSSLSPILPYPCSSPPPLSMTKSYILNDDNTFALPLTVLNDTFVFDINPY